jgi:acetamidase/formamidase
VTTHRFTPTHYHRTLGPHDPVLSIAPGDTVITTTLDAGGGDQTGQRANPGGNPQTGPFFIDGAEPGDTLVVRFDRLTITRDTGFTANILAANVVDPEMVREFPAHERFNWRIDHEACTASPDIAIPGLELLAIPLAPMIGCFGVAPRHGQAISTATSAEHGGNMDYRGFGRGSTAYFPIFEPGALFHLGDGHATQGDGEIVGTGIEISMEVEFTVDLRKGWPISWPRGENDTHIFTAGNARPLDQALQHATTEMLRWLGTDYDLDPEAASHLLGQVVRYDIANVFNPAYSVACRIAKGSLAGLKV